MASLIAKHFSAVDYMQRLKKANFTDEQAETIAKETEELLSNVLEQANLNLEKKELVTDQGLQIALKELKIRLIKWVMGTGLATIVAIAGLLKFMIH